MKKGPISAGDPSIDRELEAYAEKRGAETVTYWNYHRKRFHFEAELVSRYLSEFPTGEKVRLLDIGPSFQTLMFHRLFQERVNIDTFGFDDPLFPPPPGGRHIAFDLNDAYYPDRWPRVEPYDILTMFEVIEHLYTSPVQVFRFLNSLVKSGGTIIISTPNAVTLFNRVKMLFGRNPYECIRETRNCPGHFRESTRRELTEMGEQTGLRVKETFVQNLSSRGSLASRVFRSVSTVLPPELRKELTVVFTKP
jgi:hypothetical protein